MVDDRELAAIAGDTYVAAPTWRAGDVHALFTLRRGLRIIAVRGTTADPSDWLRDLSAMPAHDRDLGFCHQGFLTGARALFAEIIGHGAAPGISVRGAVLTGHSMGGAIALLLAGVLTAREMPPRAVVTFGAPRCGSWKLRRLLRRVPLRLYRNGDDPVPDVPWLPGLYLHPRALMPIGEPAFDPLADHPIAAYRRALAAIEETC